MDQYHDSDGQLIEKEFYKYLKDNDLLEEDDGEIREEIAFADKLLKGSYKLINDVGVDEDDKVIGRKGDTVTVFSDQAQRYSNWDKMFLKLYMIKQKMYY